jgi:hypothetical protein
MRSPALAWRWTCRTYVATRLKLAEMAGKTGLPSLLQRTTAPCENGVGGEEDYCSAFGATPHFSGISRHPIFIEQLSLN